MLIGILSDTHDQAARTRRAIELLIAAGAEYFIHCGDITEEPILDLLAGLPAAAVFGNNDMDRPALTAYGQHLGINMLGTIGILDLGGKRFAVTHGDRGGLIRSAMETPGVDYVLLGHTHVIRDERLKSIRMINPGALHRAALKTVATLDTATDHLQIIRVDEPAARID